VGHAEIQRAYSQVFALKRMAVSNWLLFEQLFLESQKNASTVDFVIVML